MKNAKRKRRSRLDVIRKPSFIERIALHARRALPLVTKSCVMGGVFSIILAIGLLVWQANAQPGGTANRVAAKSSRSTTAQKTAAVAKTDYAFTGQYIDPHTGLQYHRGRWYDPKAGIYLSPDPTFDFPNNFGNQYAYVGHNPTNRIDPTGAYTVKEVVQALATRAYLGYDQYSNLKDIVNITTRIAAGQSVAGYEIAMVMWSLLPNSPNPPRIRHLPPHPGRHVVPDDEIRAFNEAIRRYAPALGTPRQVGDFGEMALKQRGVTRGMEPLAKGLPGVHGYDAVFRQGDKIVIGEAKAGMNALDSVNWSHRKQGWIPRMASNPHFQKYGAPPYKQGTSGWVADYAYELKAKNIPLGTEILEKIENGDVVWYEVRTQIDGGVVRGITEEIRNLSR